MNSGSDNSNFCKPKIYFNHNFIRNLDLKRASQLPGSGLESSEGGHLAPLPNGVGHHRDRSRGRHPPLTSYCPGCAANM